MRTDEIREKYLTFFEGHGCVRRPSDVLVPRWDPSVLFTPAGMNQFKDHFLGRCKLEFTRATTCQKCLRTGDIDNVGRTPRHHTFFEMLGNFSFGDYFKEEAITWAWDFLTSKKWLGIDPDRLTISVYEDDQEAADIWHEKIGLPTSRITHYGEADNFWPASAPSQGPDGVCGPCSEVFYHHENGSEVEIWNLVFTQFQRVGDPPNNLRPLPSKNIDTGMGLERTAAVLQGVDSNFHIDILHPLVEAVSEVCGIKYQPEDEHGRRARRIADHVRACTFAIHENVYPGPNKEKYVIKRLLRRAVLDGRQIGMEQPFLHTLVPKVAELMRAGYPELGETSDRVADVIRKEEANFFSTIDAGLDRIHQLFDQMHGEGRLMVSGEDAAEMYTTHGFPPELMESLAAERGLTFDWPGYDQAMEEHGIQSGAGQRVELFSSGPLDALKKALGGSRFLGYEATSAQAKVIGLISHDHLCDELEVTEQGEQVVVVLDQTPFYGESGGQVGDTGEIRAPDAHFQVLDTHKDGDFTLHVGRVTQGTLQLGAKVEAQVDAARRQAIQRAHSATHILHHALQKHLGSHALQQGSKVDADWLRFDFTHPQAVTQVELACIEEEINRHILAADPIRWRRMPLDEARQGGAMMLFGEKYPDEVRVVAMGEFSKELCGGTHAGNTGELGLLRIVSEESVSAGTRRITAITGPAILRRLTEQEASLSRMAATLRAPLAELPQRVEKLFEESKKAKKLIKLTGTSAIGTDAVGRIGGWSYHDAKQKAEKVGDVMLIVAEASVPLTADAMRGIIDQFRKKDSPVAVLLAARQGEDKVLLVAGISRDLQDQGMDAGAWIRAAAKAVGGGGGGRKDLAQAGGKNPAGLPQALDIARQTAQETLAQLTAG